jgi:hypothetical protein
VEQATSHPCRVAGGGPGLPEVYDRLALAMENVGANVVRAQISHNAEDVLILTTLVMARWVADQSVPV